MVTRCPNAKKYRVQVGKSDQHKMKYICKGSCTLCHGSGALMDCPVCGGAGLKAGGLRCETCGTTGNVAKPA